MTRKHPPQMRFSLPEAKLCSIEPQPQKRKLLTARLTGNHYEMGRLETRLGCTISEKLSDSGACAKFQSAKKFFRRRKAYSANWENNIHMSGIVLLHIPKAAGTSICQVIYGTKAGDHRSLRDYQCVFTVNQFENFQIIAVTRDPTSRFLSAFNYLKQGGRNKHDELTRDQFLADSETAYDFAVKCCDEPRLLNLLHFRPQTTFLETSTEDVRGRVHIFRIEEMDEIQKFLSDSTQQSVTIPKRNVTSCDTVSPPSRKLQAVVERLYRSDFAKLGY